MQLRKFKIRASGASNIMGRIGLTDTQQKELDEMTVKASSGKGLTDIQKRKYIDLCEKKENPPLPKTMITYLETWVKEELYSRNEEFGNKYTEKGLKCEDGAIEFVANIMDWDFADKNEMFFQDEHFTGTPDLLVGDSVEDIKCSWDCFTFPLFDTELPTPAYFYQLQVYMAMTGKKRGGVNYCLMDAPEEMILKECSKKSYADGMNGDITAELEDEVRSNMTYSHFPNELRHKRFEVKRDDETIQLMRDRVELCRKYINEIILPTLK